MKKTSGVFELESLLEDLFNYGIFVVPVGKMESWTMNDIRGNQNLQKRLNVINSKEKRILRNFLKKVLV